MAELVTESGRCIHYDVQGNGPPLLLLAGTPVGRRIVGPDAEAFARSCRVVTMDNRDAGENDPEERPYTIADMADDAEALLARLGIERAHVLGASTGGLIALQLTLAHPERVNHLILLSSPATGEVLPEQDETPPEWWSDDPVERLRPMLADLVGPEYRAALTGEKLDALADLERGNRITWAGALRQEQAVAGFDPRERLQEITAPTLVIHGQVDPAVPLADGEALAAGIPGARLVVFAGVGHLVGAERAEEFHQVVLDFLGAAP